MLDGKAIAYHLPYFSYTSIPPSNYIQLLVLVFCGKSNIPTLGLCLTCDTLHPFWKVVFGKYHIIDQYKIVKRVVML